MCIVSNTGSFGAETDSIDPLEPAEIMDNRIVPWFWKAGDDACRPEEPDINLLIK